MVTCRQEAYPYSCSQQAFVVDTLVDLKNYLQMDENVQGEELARLYPEELLIG